MQNRTKHLIVVTIAAAACGFRLGTVAMTDCIARVAVAAAAFPFDYSIPAGMRLCRVRVRVSLAERA